MVLKKILIENEIQILERGLEQLEDDFARNPSLRYDFEFQQKVSDYNIELKRAKRLSFLDPMAVKGYETRYQNLINEMRRVQQ